jgi:hypothetical protein
MKTSGIRAIIILIILSGSSLATFSQNQELNDTVISGWKEINVFYDDNEKCFTCHGEESYTLFDSVAGISRIRNMLEDYHISREDYYHSNHKSFSCTDCHSADFVDFPHSVPTRLEEHFACLDCHGNDENYSQFKFEEIEMEYNQSTHAKVDDFSCWKCHNPHTYKPIARNTTDIREIVLYDNNMCLACHANFKNFRLLTDREEINVINRHEWLPNQILHFKSVRCIECHTQISDSILIAHLVLPKDSAVRNCTECHSSDSRLMSTLYKFESKGKRENGFLNAIILGKSYVIGASRNVYLGYLSFIIFIGVLAVIGVHTFFRVIKSKRS